MYNLIFTFLDNRREALGVLVTLNEREFRTEERVNVRPSPSFHNLRNILNDALEIPRCIVTALIVQD
jgi:hypothetical protein